MEWPKIIIFIFSVITAGKGSVVNRCTGGELLPDVLIYPSIDKEPCQKSPCEVQAGSQVYLATNFTAPRYLENIVPKILATASGFQIDYSFGLGQNDACDGLKNTVCPLVENEVVQYGLSLKLQDWLPKVGVSLEFSIVDKDIDSNVLCFVFDISVV